MVAGSLNVQLGLISICLVVFTSSCLSIRYVPIWKGYNSEYLLYIRGSSSTTSKYSKEHPHIHHIIKTIYIFYSPQKDMYSYPRLHWIVNYARNIVILIIMTIDQIINLHYCNKKINWVFILNPIGNINCNLKMPPKYFEIVARLDSLKRSFICLHFLRIPIFALYSLKPRLKWKNWWVSGRSLTWLPDL